MMEFLNTVDIDTIGRILQYFIPGFFAILYRIYGMGAKSRHHAIMGVCLFSCVSLIVPSILIPALGYEIYRFFAFLITVIANLSVFIISSDSFLKTIYLYVTQLNIVFWVSIMASSLRRMFGLTYIEGDILRLLFSVVIYILALRYFTKPLRFIVDTVHSKWLSMITVPACIATSSLMVSIYFGIQPFYPEILMMLVMTLLQLSFLFYMRSLYTNLQDELLFSRERTRHTLLQAEIRSYEDALEELKRTRHDLRHHNAVLLEYLTNGQTKQAIEYLETDNSAMDITGIKQYCKNVTCNAIFRIFTKKAERENISFALQLDIPETLDIQDTDLNVMLSNLLENAVEACIKLPFENRSITLAISRFDNGLRLEMENNMQGIVKFRNDLPMSTKKDGGIGTKSVEIIVKKYNGLFCYRQEQDKFITKIFLPI